MVDVTAVAVCQALAPEHELQYLKTDIGHGAAGGSDHPVEEDVCLLLRPYYVALCDRIEKVLLGLKRVVRIVFAAFGKVDRFGNCLLGLNQDRERFAVGIRHVFERLDGADSDAEIDAQSFGQFLLRIVRGVDDLLVFLRRERALCAGDQDRDLVAHDRARDALEIVGNDEEDSLIILLRLDARRDRAAHVAAGFPVAADDGKH